MTWRSATVTMLLGSLVVCGPAAAKGLAVFPAQGTNIESDALEAIGAVLANAYLAESGRSVIGPAAAIPALEQTGSPARAAAELGADEYLLIEVVRLDQKMLISVGRYTAAGELIFREQMAAYSLDDMEQVGPRLARALHRKVPVEQTRDWHTVTAKEASPENRLFAEKLVGFKLAGLFGLCSADMPLAGVVSAQFDLRMEASGFFLEFGAGLKLAANSSHPYNGGLFAEVGGSFYMTEAEHAPYIGLGLIARIDFEDDSLANMAPYLQLGYMLFRSSSTRLYVDLRVSHDLFVHREKHYNEPDDKWRMTEVGMLMGVGW